MHVTALVILLVAGTPALAGDTLESVEKTVIERGKKITSMQYKSRSVSNYDTAGWKYKAKTEGESWYKKQGDTTLFRMESTTQSVTVQDGKEVKSKSISTMVCDGKFIYTLTDTDGQKSAMKLNMANQSWIMDKAYFDNLRKGNTLKLLPDETVEGRSTYVIEATPKETGASSTTGVSYMYFDKKTGLVIKMVSKDTSGNIVMTSVSTDLKVNSSISDDRFVFKTPEGVQLIDTTQTQTAEPTQSAQQEPATTDEPEKPQTLEQEDESKEPVKSEKSGRPKLPKLPKRKWP